MRIDVHAHHYDDVYFDRLERLGNPWQGGRFAPGAGVTLEQRLDLMDEAGIDAQVLCVGASQPGYLPDKAKAVEGARFANDHYKEVVERYNGRFAAFGCLPLPHLEAAIEECARCFDELHFSGINLGCSMNGRALDEPEFEPLWQELDRRSAIVFLHPLGLGGAMMDKYGLAWMVGGCFEDTVAGLRLAMSGLMERHRNVRIIVPHLGGTIPFVWQRLEDSYERSREQSRVNPVAALERMYYDTVNETPAALRCTCDAVGAGHIMLGTDFPYLAGPKFKRCVTYVQESGLPQADVDAILDKNAQELLQLPKPLQ
ncbi:MAG TPA: amidohydrolase family protein [Chloroflexota bacterium]|nr:amidohydrolase family protein [Chloroflexota bacterium]